VRPGAAAVDDVHRRLDAVLPGAGRLRERYVAWAERNGVPRERLVRALARLNEVLAPRAHPLAPMATDETVVYELVGGVPWMAYNRYEGMHRSRVEVNADLPVSIVQLVTLAAHEAYPGHHTERVAKEVGLLRAQGRAETGVVITPAPESVVSEGIALVALEQALGSEPFNAVADVLGELAPAFDPVEAHEVHRAELALYDTVTTAAFMLHEDGAEEAEARAYLQERALESDERAARTVAFVTDPGSRAYVTAYPDGRRLCEAFVAGRAGSFRRLLTEQLTVADLAASA